MDIGTLEARISLTRAALGYVVQHGTLSPIPTMAVLRGVDELLADTLAEAGRAAPAKTDDGRAPRRRWTETSTSAAIDEAFAEAERIA